MPSTATEAISGPGDGRRRSRRVRAVLPTLAVCVALLGVGACGGGGGDDEKKTKDPGVAATKGTGGGGDAPQTSKAVVTIVPKDGATDVATDGALKVSAVAGKLTQVTVTTSEGKAVEGTLSPDGATWTPGAALQTGTKYAVSATATDAAGLLSAMQSSFTTLTPANTNYGVFNIDANATYGVGMIVSLEFTKAVTDKAVVNQAVTVTSEPAVDVKGHWFGDKRLDFRPEKYWAPGTKVTLHLNLDGKQTSPGVYGKQKKDVTFTVGRAQTSVADNTAHTLTVTRDGAVLKKLPASLGDAQFTTYNGKMTIMSKEPTVHMQSQSIGLDKGEFDIPDVPHGMRLSVTGTYVHGNYWRKPPPFGKENTSHGCVSLQDVKGGGDPNMAAAWFYKESLIGDVVEVINSPDKVIAADNGWSGWTMAWDKWTATS
ncbi:Ig-like domain-containing protein [Embleya sp. NBC_00896]|uniref:L,D-transpeptidase n=1 Tax=Embleya sp. NBC_00896 TaxID=2975961 RepID=UPI0038707F16|nr:Ig-like domain-containing protein [Embleya sp. NBC_00896]